MLKSSMISQEVQYMFKSSIRSKECSRVKEFKSSIPLHFDMLNATPYSLSIEGNLILERMNRFKYSMPRK
jgi:hypothetical protein